MPPYFILKVIAVILRLFAKLLPRKKAQPDNTLEIPSRSGDRNIRVHVYDPPGLDPGNPQPTPVLINFCGSGFVMNGHGIDDEFCHYIANNTRHTVLDVEYRLAPEHPFPAALDDAREVIDHVKAKPGAYYQDRISISGFSAGANIAVSIAMNCYEPDDFYAVIAFYPPVDASINPKNKKAPVAVPTSHRGSIPAFLLRFFQDCYLYPRTDPANPRVSPSHAPLASFPRNSLWITAEQDTLATEAEALASEGKKNTCCSVTELRVLNCGHAWDKFAKDGTPQAYEKRKAYALAKDILVKPHPKPSTPEAGPSGTQRPPTKPVPGEESAAGSSESTMPMPRPLLEEPQIPTEPPRSKTQPVPVPVITIEPSELTTSANEPSREESLADSPKMGKGKVSAGSSNSPLTQSSGEVPGRLSD